MGFIAECFCAARAGDGERSGNVAEPQAIFDFCPANILMNEASIETVTRAYSVNRGALLRRRGKYIAATLRHGAVRAALDYNQRHALSEKTCRALHIVGARNLAGFVLIR